MIRLGDLSQAVIVQMFAKTGHFCRTAQLVFLGAEKPKGVKHSGTAPGKFPPELIRECEQARREYLAGTFKDRVTFADVPEEAA